MEAGGGKLLASVSRARPGQLSHPAVTSGLGMGQGLWILGGCSGVGSALSSCSTGP